MGTKVSIIDRKTTLQRNSSNYQQVCKVIIDSSLDFKAYFVPSYNSDEHILDCYTNKNNGKVTTKANTNSSYGIFKVTIPSIDFEIVEAGVTTFE